MGIQMSKLRAIAVVYSDGSFLTTNMAEGLSDKEMLEYFATGKGNARKPLMIANAKSLYGYDGEDDNIADALHLLKLAEGELK